MNNVFFAFVLSSFAGLCTGLGALPVFFTRRKCPKFLSFSLGFSAGIMIFLSFFHMLKEAELEFKTATENGSHGYTIAVFIGGLAIAALVDFLTHDKAECFGHGSRTHCAGTKDKIPKTGIFVALAIALHNFPEGIATFMTANVNVAVGIYTALAVAIHNIPEGMCVALPIYHETGSKVKSAAYALLSGLTEPLGALAAYLILRPFISPFLMGAMIGAVAGIMVYVSIDELLPTAWRCWRWHTALAGLVFGMAFMAFSLYVLNLRISARKPPSLPPILFLQ